jgi:hypothetical protein
MTNVREWLKREDCLTKAIEIDNSLFNELETRYLSEGIILNRSVETLKFVNCEFHQSSFEHFGELL